MDPAAPTQRTADGAIDAMTIGAAGGAAIDHDLTALIARRAVDAACCGPAELGIRFHRIARPITFHKTHALGPSLTVVAQGHKVVRFGSRELAYNPARCIVITGETTYDGEVIAATAARPYLAATIELPVDLITKTVLALAEDGAPPPDDAAWAYVTAFDASIKSVVLRLFGALDDPIERRIVAPLVREELVFRLLRSEAAAVVRAAVRTRDAPAIHEAMRFIRSNATRALSVRAIARHVAMSPSHFAHRFRAVARVSPMRYLKRVRLDDARALMLANQLRIGEIAAQVGYESASHFSRDFKLAFGITPAEFGRRARAR